MDMYSKSTKPKHLITFNLSSWPKKTEDLLTLALTDKFSETEDLRDHYTMILSTGAHWGMNNNIGEASSHDTPIWYWAIIAES